MRIRDPDRSAGDLQNPPRRIAQLEHVARLRLDREVLVERADERLSRLQDDAVVGDFGNRAARGDCASSRAPRRPRTVAFTSSRCTSAARRPRRVEKPSAVIFSTASKSARVRSRYGHARRTSANSIFAVVAARAFRDDLLRQHVEGESCGTIASSSPRRTARSSAAHSTRSSRVVGNSRPFGVPPMVWPDRPTRCSSVAIRCGEPIWQTRSTWPMSMPSSSDAVATIARQAARLQPALCVEPRLLREAAVMCRHRVLAEPLGEMTGHALGHPPSVDEDQRRPVRADQRGQPVVVLLPHLVRHHRFERRTRQLDRQIHRAAVTCVDDGAGGRRR